MGFSIPLNKLPCYIQRNHTKTTKYECDKCSYSTFDYGSIGVHKRRIHNKTSHIQCNECEKSFDKKSDYAEHLFEQHNIVYQYK